MFRSASPSDLDVLLCAHRSDPVTLVEADGFRRELALGQYRLEWSWIYEVDNQLLPARCGGAPGLGLPGLDCLWVDPSISDPALLGGRLLRAGHTALRATGIGQLPDLNLSVPTDWKDDPMVVAVVSWRSDAAASAGLTETIERLSYVWIPARGDRRAALD